MGADPFDAADIRTPTEPGEWRAPVTELIDQARCAFLWDIARDVVEACRVRPGQTQVQQLGDLLQNIGSESSCILAILPDVTYRNT